MRDIVGDGAAILHRNRPVAGRRFAPRAAGIAEDAPRQLREIDQVLIDEAVAGAAETRQPILDVSGIRRLAHLAVIDDVDAGLRLFGDDLADGTGYAFFQGGAFDGHAFFLGEHHPYQVGRTRQAAGMRR